MSNWHRICCPVDFSDTSRVALEEAADQARRSGGELTVLHVFGLPPTSAEAAVVPPPDLLAATARELERKLAIWKEKAEAIRGGAVEAKVVEGSPAREIVRFASEGGFDLIVMGTHGRTGFRRLVLGSVAEGVLREAECAVLVVRSQER